MKKIISSLAMVFAVAMSSSAMAATTWGETDNEEAVTAGVGGDCALLATNVTLSVSANVMGGYACDEGNNIIQVAACHQGGSRDEVSCSSYDASSNPIPGCTDTTGVGNPDFKAFWAASTGGVMQTKNLGDRCTEASLGGLSSWAN